MFAAAIAACLFIVPTLGLKLELSNGNVELNHRGSFLTSDAKLSHRQEVSQHVREISQPPDVTVTTTHQNFFQRMGNAFMGMVVGLIMMCFSIPVLWINEQRNAKYEALIATGEAECRSISADDFDQKNTHWLVHVTGNTVSTQPVTLPNFNVRFESGVIKLVNDVEIYQYKEEEKSQSKEKETFGGGKTTETRKWKEYSAMWLGTYNSGQNFEKQEYQNSKPAGITAGSQSETCKRVEFGKGFLLSAAELDQFAGVSGVKFDKLVCEQYK